MSGEGPGHWTPPHPPSPHRPLLTKVEVASLVLGLEEAPPGLGMDVSSLGHQELHIVFAAPLDGDVQGGLTWGGGEGLSRGGGDRKWTRLEGGVGWGVQRVEVGGCSPRP